MSSHGGSCPRHCSPVTYPGLTDRLLLRLPPASPQSARSLHMTLAKPVSSLLAPSLCMLLTHPMFNSRHAQHITSPSSSQEPFWGHGLSGPCAFKALFLWPTPGLPHRFPATGFTPTQPLLLPVLPATLLRRVPMSVFMLRLFLEPLSVPSSPQIQTTVILLRPPQVCPPLGCLL